MSSKLVALFILIFCSLYTLCFGQDFSMQGSFKIDNYPQKIYKGAPQVFDIQEGPFGNLLFANQRGLNIFDGENWDIVIFDNKKEAIGCYVGEDEIIASSNLGLIKLTFDEQGAPVQEELHTRYTNDPTELAHVGKFKNFFFTNSINHLFILDENYNKITDHQDPKGGISGQGIINDELFFQGKNESIYTFKDSRIEVILESTMLDEQKVTSIILFNSDTLLITESEILKWTKNEELQILYSSNNKQIKNAINLNDQFISLGHSLEGIVILDNNYQPQYEITTEKGLGDGTILSQYQDKEGNLWLGTANGISKVQLNSPILSYDHIFDQATIEQISQYRNKLVLATGGGAFLLDTANALSQIEGVGSDCFGVDLINIYGDTSIYISGLNQVFEYDGQKATPISDGGPYMVKQSPLNKNQIFVLHYDGIQVLEKTEKGYNAIGYLKGFSQGEPFNFIIQEDGSIWIGTKPNDGVYKINAQDILDGEYRFERYHTNQGLPKGQTYLFLFENQVYAATDEGLYKFNGSEFEYSDFLGIDFVKERLGIHRIYEDSKGKIWMILFEDIVETYQIGYCERISKKWQWHPEQFYGYDEYIAHAIFEDLQGKIWIGGPGGLMRFDADRNTNNNINYRTQIRQINFGDSIIFKGNGIPPSGKEFSYDSKKNVSFKFSANSFSNENQNEYSYILEGYNSDWSTYSKTSTKDFTLQEGVYTFKVKCKNIYGVESKIAIYEFEVLPPWYRTWWAYGLFAIIGILCILIIVRLSLFRIKQQNIKLEKVIEERTQEVVAQKAEAEKQRDIANLQKELIEEKNEEILDSISYAKRLQDAILPPLKDIYEVFPNSFVLYIPKDIVAGDFYWTNLAKFNSREKLNFIAAADCTGHGVPGAMVSVVCSNALDRALKEFSLRDPGLILDKVTDLVIETFEKSENEVKDGMDIALYSIEQQNDGSSKVAFAGANNPLWVVSEKETIKTDSEILAPILQMGNYNLFEIKPSKQPIGKYAIRRPFESHSINLSQGDKLYSFTDGYADQFGGKNGKKYKYTPFKKFILSIQNNVMKDQINLLNDEFNRWKGEFEQIDDVCIIGVQV